MQRKKFIQKQQLEGHISEISETTYLIENGKKNLLKHQKIKLTKNGRIKFSETFNTNNKLIETIEKKLFFNKKSFPNKESYYCKTRWKPNRRERISCYSQKRYKQNEIIVQYHNNGTIANIKDNFSSFNTYVYEYGKSKNKRELPNIVILDKKGNFTDRIITTCITKDTLGNCIELEKNYTRTKKLERIGRVITYD